MTKIDMHLLKVIAAGNQKQEIECFVYVSHINKAKQDLQKHFNVKVLKEFAFINILHVSGSPQAIVALSRLDVVNFVSSLSKVSALVSISKKALKFNEGKYTGKGVTIAYIDTGIKPHLDFVLCKNRLLKFVDLIEEKDTAYDDNGHGTFVAGVGSGSGVVCNYKYEGFAPSSNIVSIKALNKKGEASASKILEAMQWVYLNHKDYNIKVVCMSFGSEPLGYNDPIMQGAEMLWKVGVLVVAAAGNSGPEYETIKSPGISPKIITVGGLNDNRKIEAMYSENFFEIAAFSSRGPALKRFKPDLVAPSVDIVSCGIDKNFYTTLSGTSVSTPMVAGICASALEKSPNLKPEQIKKRLLWACKPITFNKNYEGYGLLDAGKFFTSV
jgi:serine protease AprX